MRRRVFSGLMATALLSLSAAPVFAQAAPTDLGTFKAWTAWKGADENGAICFISAAPESSEPKEVNGVAINRDPDGTTTT